MCVTHENNVTIIYKYKKRFIQVKYGVHTCDQCASMAHFSRLYLLRCIYIRRRGEWCNVYPFTKQTPSRIKQKSTEQRSRNLTANELSSVRLAMEDGGHSNRSIYFPFQSRQATSGMRSMGEWVDGHQHHTITNPVARLETPIHLQDKR